MLKVYITVITGAVLFFNTAPFLFSQTSYENLKLDNLQFSSGDLNRFNTLALKISENDTVKSKPFKMKKKPWLAVLLSAVMPGAGQFYNRSFWKIPVIIGLCGYFGYTVYDQHKKYSDYRERYASSQTPANPGGDPLLKSLREFYHDQRNDFIWYFTITYLVNLIDAYVDAHLFDFDVSEETIGQLNIINKKYSLRLSVNF